MNGPFQAPAQRSALLLLSELESSHRFPLGHLGRLVLITALYTATVLSWEGGTFFLLCWSLGGAQR